MRPFLTVCLCILTWTFMHNIYLYNFEEDEINNWQDEMVNKEYTGIGSVITGFMTSSIHRVKRRIFYSNETLPTMDTSIFGNRTGRNRTVSLIKLLNKNYFLLKKQYLAILEKNKSAIADEIFNGRRYMESKKAATPVAKTNASAVPPSSGVAPPAPAKPAAPAPTPAPSSVTTAGP